MALSLVQYVSREGNQGADFVKIPPDFVNNFK
jgi:hypothetical protein